MDWGTRSEWTMVVAISVIVVCTTAVAFPVFAGDHGHRRTLCLSNVKQVGTGLAIYMADEDGKVTPADRWMDRIFPYVKNEDIFHCPEQIAYGYALNEQMAGQVIWKWDEADLAATPLIFESRTLGRSVTGPPSLMPSVPRHKGGNFVTFANLEARRVSISETEEIARTGRRPKR